jgi:hypothetical protein
MESVLDSAHLGQLHRSAFDRMDLPLRSESGRQAFEIFKSATAPKFEVERTPYGFKEGAIRHLSDGRRHVNFRQFVAPYFSLLPSAAGDTRIAAISVAHDDEWMSQIIVSFRLDRPFTPQEIEEQWKYSNPDPNNFAGDLGGPNNRWGQDREAMKAGYASGFPSRHIFQEDFIVQESMGAIVDRTRENLGSSDAVIIHTRRELIRAAHAFKAGALPWGLDDLEHVDFRNIRSTNRFLADEEDWRTIDPIAEAAALESAGNVAGQGTSISHAADGARAHAATA